MLEVEQWAEIRRMHQVDRLSIREINRRTGLHRDTIRRALASPEPPRYERTAKRPSKLDPFKSEIEELLRRDPRMSKTSELSRIFRALKAPAAARALPKLAERARTEDWSYERASMIVTSNKPFSAWGEIFGEETVAAAMIDRLVHHAEILALAGDSYRLKDKDLGPAEPQDPEAG